MTTTSHRKPGSPAGWRVRRRLPDTALRPIVSRTVQPVPAPSAWRRLWAALWRHETPEQLYARQQRRAALAHPLVMTVGGHLALTPAPDMSRPVRSVQADLP